MNAWLMALVLAQTVGGAQPPAPPPASPAVEAAPAQPATPPPQQLAPQAPAAPQVPSQAPAQDPGQGMWQTLIFMGVMILVFWLLIIRPQSKQRKKQEEFLKKLVVGDRVVTTSGLIGRIAAIEGDVVTLDLGKDVRVRLLKGHVTSHYQEGDNKA